MAGTYTVTTLTKNPPRFLQGYEFTALASVAWTGTTATADTFTISNFFPDKKFTLMDFEIVAPIMDSGLTPGTLNAGNTASATGYINAGKMGHNNAQDTVLTIAGNGANLGTLIDPATTGNRDVIVTLGTVGTGVASGTLYVRARYLAGAV